jgi:tetratricopeptide (TPR) repeat protein
MNTVFEHLKMTKMRSNYKYTNQVLGRYGFLLLLLLILSTTGCTKFLDQKPNKSDVIPTTLNDLQTLLDNASIAVNSRSSAAFSELVADNYYVNTNDWQSMLQGSTSGKSEALNYIWDKQAIPYNNGWYFPYQNPVYYSNIVLDQLSVVNVKPGEEQKLNAIKGSALFYRAFAFWGLAQLFCKPYAAENASSPGIVLRLTSNVSAPSARATVQQTYDQVIADLKTAADLLPLTTVFSTRPTRTAAYAALARAYLSMRDYINAAQYANLALQQSNTLMDYNTLVPVGSPPVKSFNPEVIFHDGALFTTLLFPGIHKIDSTLYASYDGNDLRKTVFFGANTGADSGTYFFQGSYDGNGRNGPSSIFDGLTVDEMYLIRAECAARKGNKDAALLDLNTLMIKRWNNNGSWVPFTAADATDALNKILVERRKELLFRGLRWSDIRRLNLEGANIIPQRIIAGTTYSLPPNDLRTVMLIPIAEINYAGVAQNPR